jgi:hypothetical protein
MLMSSEARNPLKASENLRLKKQAEAIITKMLYKSTKYAFKKPRVKGKSNR